MDNKNKRPGLVNTLILTAITVAFWIVASVISAFKSPSEVKVPKEVLTPLNPNLDSATLNEVESRIYFSEDEIGESLILPSTPEPEATSTPKPEASSEGTQTATGSGTVDQNQEEEIIIED